MEAPSRRGSRVYNRSDQSLLTHVCNKPKGKRPQPGAGPTFLALSLMSE